MTSTIGIMQPYFFPYVGYFSLMKCSSKFILLDEVQFIYHGWIERNRILKPGSGWQYIHVPLKKHHRDILIKQAVINNEIPWKKTIVAQFQHYKKRAPYFSQVMRILEEVFEPDYDDIVELNRAALECVGRYLGIAPAITIFSRMGIDMPRPNSADEWALNICKALPDVSAYVNPIGGVEIFDREKYQNGGVPLKFQKVVIEEYDQRRTVFEPALSILDVLMFNSSEEASRMLDNYTLE